MSRPGLCTYPLQKKKNSSDLALHCVFARGWLTLPNQPASQFVVLLLRPMDNPVRVYTEQGMRAGGTAAVCVMCGVDLLDVCRCLQDTW